MTVSDETTRGAGCLTDETCELAALYSLGALDGADAARFESHLLDGCEACEDELSGYDDVTSMLALAAPPASPPPELRRAVLDEVAGTLQPSRFVPSLATVGTWEPHVIPGVKTRRLHVDRATRTILMLVHAAPGTHYPPHEHAGVEEMVMLEGELTIGDQSYRAGDLIRSTPGSVHEPSVTRGGCLFLIRTSLDDRLVA